MKIENKSSNVFYATQNIENQAAQDDVTKKVARVSKRDTTTASNSTTKVPSIDKQEKAVHVVKSEAPQESQKTSKLSFTAKKIFFYALPVIGTISTLAYIYLNSSDDATNALNPSSRASAFLGTFATYDSQIPLNQLDQSIHIDSHSQQGEKNEYSQISNTYKELDESIQSERERLGGILNSAGSLENRIENIFGTEKIRQDIIQIKEKACNLEKLYEELQEASCSSLARELMEPSSFRDEIHSPLYNGGMQNYMLFLPKLPTLDEVTQKFNELKRMQSETIVLYETVESAVELHEQHHLELLNEALKLERSTLSKVCVFNSELRSLENKEIQLKNVGIETKEITHIINLIEKNVSEINKELLDAKQLSICAHSNPPILPINIATQKFYEIQTSILEVENLFKKINSSLESLQYDIESLQLKAGFKESTSSQINRPNSVPLVHSNERIEDQLKNPDFLKKKLETHQNYTDFLKKQLIDFNILLEEALMKSHSEGEEYMILIKREKAMWNNLNPLNKIAAYWLCGAYKQSKELRSVLTAHSQVLEERKKAFFKSSQLLKEDIISLEKESMQLFYLKNEVKLGFDKIFMQLTEEIEKTLKGTYSQTRKSLDLNWKLFEETIRSYKVFSVFAKEITEQQHQKITDSKDYKKFLQLTSELDQFRPLYNSLQI